MRHPSPPALSLFSCYAREDASLRDQFEKHLAMVKRLGWIQSWSDRDVSAGAEWQHALDHYLHTADLFLLFVSAHFIASEFCYSLEMQEVLKRHQTGEAHVIPILLRPVEWEKTPLGMLQALPRDSRPVTSWSNPDEAFLQIAQEIRVVIEALRRHVVIVSSVSHQTFTNQLVHALTTRGIPIREAGYTPEPASLKDDIREASTVVVIASSEIKHTRTLKEVERLSEMYQRPLLGVWISHEEQDDGQSAPQPLQRQEWIPALPGQEESTFQQISTALHRKRTQGAPLPIVASPAEQEISQGPRNPYKGLRAFTAKDARDFFGRTPLIGTLVASLETILSFEKKGQQPGRLLAVVGASGSGKSSLVHSGLLPALRAGQVMGSDTWTYLDPIVPGTHPLDALTLTLFEQFPEKSFKQFREDLNGDSTSGLHLYTTVLAKRKGCAHVVLAVDQFEEVFTLTTNEQERQQFLDLLVTACTMPGGSLLVILTFRADFYDRLMQYPALYQLLAAHLTPMLPMALSDLRAVIMQPALLPDVHLSFEGNLVGDMLFDLQGQIGALPLLQFTLEQLFMRREGRLLTERAYQEIGGIRGALAKHAEERYLALPSQEHRELTCTLFLRLLDPGVTEQETTRRRARHSEFLFADAKQTHLMQETMDAFVKARLLTTTANERTGSTTIEVSHEALIREWPRLVNWLREAREDLSLQQSISRDTATWEQNQHSGDRLYQGRVLKEAQALARRNTMSRQEQAFLRASATRQLRSLLTVITTILLVLTSSGIAAWIVFFQPHPDYVTNTKDDGTGSLRWAIKNAPSKSIITFASELTRQTIILKTSDIHVTQQNLIIQSPVTNHITIRVVGVSFIVDKPATVAISGITFQGSKTKDQSSLIQNAGNLSLKMCNISGNTNSASSEGGGIYNSGTLTLTSSTLSDNTASGSGYSYGGGIYNDDTLTLISSTLSDNTASSGSGYSYGGGIYNDDTLTLTSSTLSGNIASGSSNNMSYGNGGGIYSYSGTLTLTSSTLSGNIASGTGGGIYNDSPSDPAVRTHVTLVFCTIMNNVSDGIFGRDGIDIDNATIYPPIYIYIKASIIGGSDTRSTRIAGEVTSGGYNIIQRMSSVKFAKNTAQSIDRSVDDLTLVFGPSPMLGNNGGQSRTYRLIPGRDNPAIGIIPQDACTDVAGHRVLIDQREMPRPGKNKQNCDSGAYEYQAPS